MYCVFVCFIRWCFCGCSVCIASSLPWLCALMVFVDAKRDNCKLHVALMKWVVCKQLIDTFSWWSFFFFNSRSHTSKYPNAISNWWLDRQWTLNNRQISSVQCTLYTRLSNIFGSYSSFKCSSEWILRAFERHLKRSNVSRACFIFIFMFPKVFRCHIAFVIITRNWS